MSTSNEQRTTNNGQRLTRHLLARRVELFPTQPLEVGIGIAVGVVGTEHLPGVIANVRGCCVHGANARGTIIWYSIGEENRMPLESNTLRIKGLAKWQIAKVVARARGKGMSPERYLKHLVEEDIAISQQAKITRFSDLITSKQAIDEREIDRRVERAKAKHHRRASHQE